MQLVYTVTKCYGVDIVTHVAAWPSTLKGSGQKQG